VASSMAEEAAMEEMRREAMNFMVLNRWSK
jgi:hypothetical protein